MIYGDLEIHALPEGQFTVGMDKRFVPHTEGDPARPGTLFISVTPFLVRTPDETLLIDCGLGEWAEGRGTDFRAEGLARHGVSREAIDRVWLSHFHFDHSGGAIASIGADWRPTFPNAEYIAQAGELTGAGYKDESLRARDLVAETLDREGQLVTVEGDGEWGRVAYQMTGGHTECHQLFRIASGDLSVIYGGDVMGTPGQVSRRFQAKYDVDGRVSQQWRDRLAAEAAETGNLLLFYHSTGSPAAFVEAGVRGGYSVDPVDL